MKVLRFLFLALLIVSLAFAQEEDLATGDFSFSFSALHAGSSQTILTHTSLGGIGTLGWNINPHIGIEAEFGGYHNGFVDSFHDDTNSETYLFGPRFSYGRLRRFDPYFHALIGGTHTATSVLNAPSVNPLVGQSSYPARHTVSQDGLTLAIGGGVDIRVTRYISFRPVQIDYLPSILSDIGPSGLTNNGFRHNFRFSVGLMFQSYELW